LKDREARNVKTKHYLQQNNTSAFKHGKTIFMTTKDFANLPTFLGKILGITTGFSLPSCRTIHSWFDLRIYTHSKKCAWYLQ